MVAISTTPEGVVVIWCILIHWLGTVIVSAFVVFVLCISQLTTKKQVDEPHFFSNVRGSKTGGFSEIGDLGTDGGSDSPAGKQRTFPGRKHVCKSSKSQEWF